MKDRWAALYLSGILVAVIVYGFSTNAPPEINVEAPPPVVEEEEPVPIPQPTYSYHSVHQFDNNHSEITLNITDGNGTISWKYDDSANKLTVEGVDLRFSIWMTEAGSFDVQYVDYFLFIKVNDEEITVWGEA